MPKKVVRTSYWSPKDAKNKYLQVNVDKYGSLEKAKEYLNEKKMLAMKREGLLKEQNDLTKNIEEKKDIDTKIITKEEEEEDEDEEEKESTKNVGTNLIDLPIESTPTLDNIISNIKYSPFKLQIDPKTGLSITIFGSSKSYKTYLLKRIIDKYFAKDCIILLCAQNMHAEIYDDIPNSVIRINYYSPQIIKSFAMVNKKLKNKYRFVVILDDIITEKSEGNLEQLYLTLRNSRISIITCLQNIQLLKATSRGNSNIVIFRKFNQAHAVESYVMKEYLANFPPFKDLKMSDKVNLYMKITNVHDYFVLDVLNNTLILCQEDEVKNNPRPIL